MTHGGGGGVKSALRWVKYLPQRILASFVSEKFIDSPDFATQTVVVLKPNKLPVYEKITDHYLNRD
jgi:hypothetical protein